MSVRQNGGSLVILGRCVGAALATLLALAACTGPADTPAPDMQQLEVAPDTTDGDLADGTDAPADAAATCEVHADCPGPLDQCVVQTCVAQVACKSDKQCADFGKVCDLQDGRCVQCLVDGDCNDGQSCKAHLCLDAPAPCGTSKDCASGTVCDKPAAQCVGCLSDDDCDDLAHCEQTVCVTDVCHGGATACVDGSTRKACAANGGGWTSEACTGGTSCIAGSCATSVCTAGAKSCAQGQNGVATCNATGTAWGDAVACPAATSCKDAVCQPQVCTPNQKKCNAQGGMDVCAADGLGEMNWVCPKTADGKPQVCVQTGATAECKAQACVPGASFCDGQTAKVCDAQGILAAVKADCSVPDGAGKAQLCLDGACQPAACTAGSKACADVETLATCKATGDGYDKVACGQGKACEDGACLAVVCAPAAASCEGGKAVKCSAAGTKTVVVEDCGAKGKVCVNGACKAKVCTAGQISCQGAQLGTCTPDGTGWTLQACPSGETCSGGKCVAKVCDAGTMGCQGKSVAACNGSGTAWVNVEDCGGTGQTCLDGKCVAASCTPKVVQCDGKTLVECNASGTGWNPGEDCSVKGLVCIGGQCVAAVCSAGAVKCESSKVLTCNAGATAWLAGEDCSATGKVCADGKCLVCQPGAKVCSAQGKAATCSGDGGGWTEVGCDDGNACTVDSCKDGVCGSVAAKNGTSCGDKMACQAGVCVNEVPEGMVLIPAGSFMMGCVPGDGECEISEKPRHTVILDAYSIDAFEVTVAKYKKCVDAQKCTVPGTAAPNHNWGVLGREQHPVNELTWSQAVAYCNWAGGRLPTEAEWEKAARGGEDGKKYPWGDESPTCTPGQKNTAVFSSCGLGGTRAVGTASAPNGYGLYDMAGNVWESVEDRYDGSYYGSSPPANPKGPTTGSDRVSRGGGYASGIPLFLRASIRVGSAPTSGSGDHGFRCATSMP
jgi:sulfatase modifying factor 1